MEKKDYRNILLRVICMAQGAEQQKMCKFFKYGGYKCLKLDCLNYVFDIQDYEFGNVSRHCRLSIESTCKSNIICSHKSKCRDCYADKELEARA